MNNTPEIHILHVDDEPDVAELAAEFLEREDERLAVETATSASDGLDLLLDTDYDCIVSDYDMPHQDGIEFLEAVRKRHPDLPFILYTGKGTEAIASDAITAGVTDYLQKGSGTDQYTVLANRITNAVEQYRSTRRAAQLERIRHVFDSELVGIIVWDRDVRIKDANDAFLEMAGLEYQEALGTSWRDLTPEEFYPVSERHIEQVEETGSGDPYEKQYYHADGSRWWGLFESRELNDREKVEFVVEITERKEREQELERHETLVEVTGDPMYMLDSEEHFTYVNDALVETTGYSEDELLGEPVLTVMEEEHVERGEKLIRSLLPSDERQGTFEMEVVTADEERIPTENHISLLHADGEFQGSVGVLRDITDRLERERQLRRQRDKLDEFAGVVSHDLRNPLNVADGRLGLAMEDGESEHLDSVAQALERMDTLIDDLLSLARAGETVGEMETVELPALVEACWQTVETASAGLAVETETTIQADETRLQQLFENLFRNAVEYGGEDVTITVGDLPDGFYVEDDGPGIPEEEQGSIFDTGYSTAEDGTGFGLSIVRQIAEAHGWAISVTDSSDGGGRFEVTGIQVNG